MTTVPRLRLTWIRESTFSTWAGLSNRNRVSKLSHEIMIKACMGSPKRLIRATLCDGNAKLLVVLDLSPSLVNATILSGVTLTLESRGAARARFVGRSLLEGCESADESDDEDLGGWRRVDCSTS